MNTVSDGGYPADSKKRKLTAKHMVLCGLFTALTAVGAFIQIPVPFMDYFTLQFLFVLLAGMLLGSRLGAVSLTAYVAMGLFGIPIFAAGGGIQYIFRPSFGYLLGFIVAAFVVGLICEKFKRPALKHYMAAAFTGMFVTYAIGFSYKYLILNFYTQEPTAIRVIIASSLPLDIPGDAVLCVIASLLAVRLAPPLKYYK